MTESDQIQRRQFYRLRYPKHGRPVIRIDNRYYPVTETSERGLRLMISNASLYKGLSIAGTINLHDESEVELQGDILRFEDDEVILKLRKGLSFRDMVAEQRYVKQKFPSYFNRLKEQAASLM